MSMQIIKGEKLINAAIASIKNRGAKLDESIQIAGVAVLAHVQEHRDTGVADRLYHAMPKGGRRDALVQWMLKFGNFAPIPNTTKGNKQAITAGRVFQVLDIDAKTADIEGAAAMPWYNMKAQQSKPASEVFDVQAAVNALLKRVQKATADGLEIKGADKIDALVALCSI